jgi:hypothetical protein
MPIFQLRVQQGTFWTGYRAQRQRRRKAQRKLVADSEAVSDAGKKRRGESGVT